MSMRGSFKTGNGQATTEFMVALLAMAPLFLGVFYFARYADVKHSAIQASRYVAFDRAFDPYNRAKTPDQLAAEVRARFFMAGSRNDGKIQYHDSASGQDATTATNRVSLWSDHGYNPLLADYSKIQVTEADAGALMSGAAAEVVKLEEEVAAPVFSLPTQGIMRAEITVPLNNIVRYVGDSNPLSKINIGLPGATAIGIGAWNASGAKGDDTSVCNRVSGGVFSKYLESIGVALDTLMMPFERNTPDIGIILPDYDIPGSVRDQSGKNVPYTSQNGNKC